MVRSVVGSVFGLPLHTVGMAYYHHAIPSPPYNLNIEYHRHSYYIKRENFTYPPLFLPFYWQKRHIFKKAGFTPDFDFFFFFFYSWVLVRISTCFFIKNTFFLEFSNSQCLSYRSRTKFKKNNVLLVLYP